MTVCSANPAGTPGELGCARDLIGATDKLGECVLRIDGLCGDEPFSWEQERTITARPVSDGWRNRNDLKFLNYLRKEVKTF